MHSLTPPPIRLPHTSGSCYKEVWDTEFPELKSLGVCTCNIYNGLTPASLRGDAAVSYGADACNTPNYANTVLMVFALIAVYVLPLPETVPTQRSFHTTAHISNGQLGIPPSFVFRICYVYAIHHTPNTIHAPARVQN